MAKRASFKLVNHTQFLRSVERYTEAGRKAAEAELYQIGEEIMGRSKDVFVPVDTGALKGTGKVMAEKEARAFRVVMGYGDESVDYAVYVHEDLTAHHPVGQAKYLEIPFREAFGTIGDRLAQAVKRAR